MTAMAASASMRRCWAVPSRKVVTQSIEKHLVRATIVLFGFLTAVAVWVDGIGGTIAAITFNWASVQIYVDLVIAIVVLSVWMYRDAKATGRNPWPWIIAAAIVGMFSPLAYLLTREPRK